MYGLVGLIGQYNGRLMSLSSHHHQQQQQRPKLQDEHQREFYHQTTLYGLFHILIAFHHLTFAISGWKNMKSNTEPVTTYGKLEIWKYKLPFVYPILMVTSICMMIHTILLAIIITITTIMVWQIIITCIKKRQQQQQQQQQHVFHRQVCTIKTLLDTISI